jgi:uncharacterized protein (DUF362 family)
MPQSVLMELYQQEALPEKEASRRRSGMTGLADARKSGIPEAQWYAPENLEFLMTRAIGIGSEEAGMPLPIPPGSRVLIKPNWVLHRNLCDGGIDCLYTSPEFVLAALKVVLRCRPSSVTIGDAPVQGCVWEGIVTPAFRRRVSDIDLDGIVSMVDFRRTILQYAGLWAGHDLDVRPLDRFSLFDLGGDSLLEPVSSPAGRFRVTMYDPELIGERHSPGRHQYLIAGEALEADVILNLPKLKTHRKTGITGALKNLVGLNGNKEFLPHHRKGGSCSGGDCYPGRSVLKSLAESLLDRANGRIGTFSYSLWLKGVWTALAMKRLLSGDSEIDGGWSGNDTVWRTVLDINRIALYGRPDGTMAETPQRRILSVTDALICGQGNGPLSPTPLPLGCVTFSDSSVDADRLHCAILGFDAREIPSVREAGASFRWPLPSGAEQAVLECAAMADGARQAAGGVLPPEGWHCLSERRP